jgi:hypothetical protein
MEIVTANVRRWLAVMACADGRNGIGAPTPSISRTASSGDPPESPGRRVHRDHADGRNRRRVERHQPELPLTYPSIIRRLLEEQAGRLRIAPRLVCLTAETVTDEARRV